MPAPLADPPADLLADLLADLPDDLPDRPAGRGSASWPARPAHNRAVAPRQTKPASPGSSVMPPPPVRMLEAAKVSHADDDRCRRLVDNPTVGQASRESTRHGGYPQAAVAPPRRHCELTMVMTSTGRK
jgi:hypothetical protein